MTPPEDADIVPNEDDLSPEEEPVSNEAVRGYLGDLLQELGLRDRNSIPEKATIQVTFLEPLPKKGEYEYKGKERPSAVIMAIVKNEPQAGHLVVDKKYPLVISKVALNQLVNYIRLHGGNYNLKGQHSRYTTATTRPMTGKR